VKVLKYLAPQQIEIAEMPRPEIAEGEVLVQTRACGICATDVKTFMRGHPLIQPGAILGHEMSGVIAESRATDWRVGERVVVAPYVSCGQCEFCRRAQFTLCKNLWNASVEPGGLSEFIRVPRLLVQTGMARVPDSLDLETATLAEPLACCYHGLEMLNLARGDSLLIVGDGPMGLMQASIARALGASPIMLGGMTPERLAIGARYADCAVNVSNESLPDAVKRLSNGAGMDKVIVSVGSPEVAEQALAFVKRGGAINLFAGLPRGSQITLDPNRIHYDEIALLGSFGFAPGHFLRAVEALARGELDVRALITRTVTLAETASAFADSAAYRGVKTVVRFE
jgi:L-iditol 2-dehydrogenase